MSKVKSKASASKVIAEDYSPLTVAQAQPLVDKVMESVVPVAALNIDLFKARNYLPHMQTISSAVFELCKISIRLGLCPRLTGPVFGADISEGGMPSTQVLSALLFFRLKGGVDASYYVKGRSKSYTTEIGPLSSKLSKWMTTGKLKPGQKSEAKVLDIITSLKLCGVSLLDTVKAPLAAARKHDREESHRKRHAGDIKPESQRADTEMERSVMQHMASSIATVSVFDLKVVEQQNALRIMGVSLNGINEVIDILASSKTAEAAEARIRLVRIYNSMIVSHSVAVNS